MTILSYWIFLSELKNGVDGSLSTGKCAIRWMIRWTVKDGCRAYFHGGLPIAERRSSNQASEEIEREPHRSKRGNSRSEKDTIESRKEAIAFGLSETRDRGERVLKQMANTARKRK